MRKVFFPRGPAEDLAMHGLYLRCPNPVRLTSTLFNLTKPDLSNIPKKSGEVLGYRRHFKGKESVYKLITDVNPILYNTQLP